MSYEVRMKEWITDHDIRQKVLAKEFHVTEAMLSHYLTGRTEITVDVLVKFAERSGLSMDYLVGLCDEPVRPIQLTQTEQTMIENLRTLNPAQKELIFKMIALMQEQNQRA